jgi:hypothetical protein
LGNVYWGSPLPAPYQIEQSLRRWEKFVEWSHSDQIARLAASSLADGSVIGWVQSRSEFGPRALGNRSILADPRPAENRDIVNGMIKQRESFRPFAPSVLAEKASDYFDIPEGYETLPFMLFLVPVRPEQRAKLGAITHVDGTARVHTVTKNANHKYWELIQHFGDLTGIYMLLNTSFNNSAEPIVESVEDAVIAFITTGLHYLVIDDYWIAKREISDDLLLDCSLAIAPCAEFGRTGTSAGTKAWARYRHEPALAARKPTSITKLAFDVVCESDGTTPLRTLLAQLASDEDCGQAIADIRKLWWQRLIQLNTAACQAAAM